MFEPFRQGFRATVRGNIPPIVVEAAFCYWWPWVLLYLTVGDVKKEYSFRAVCLLFFPVGG